MDKVVIPTHMCLLFADHNRSLEMNVSDDEQLLVTRLEEQMFDVSE